MPVYVYYFGILPLMVVAGILITRHQRRQAAARARTVGIGRVMTEHFSHYFKLEPGEELVRFWGGLIYSGDLVPEYKDTAGDKLGRGVNKALNAVVGTTVVYHSARVLVGLTNRARVVVARDNDKFWPQHYAAYNPGDPIYMAVDFPGQSPGNPGLEVRRFAAGNQKVESFFGKAMLFVFKQFKNDKLAAPEHPRLGHGVPMPGVSDNVAFVMFGRDQGARMPAWMTGDIADVLMRWRHDPIGTTAELVAQAAPQTAATSAAPQASAA